jgi:hypothetical protein
MKRGEGQRADKTAVVQEVSRLHCIPVSICDQFIAPKDIQENFEYVQPGRSRYYVEGHTMLCYIQALYG